jgi:NlpC/P60 family protein
MRRSVFLRAALGLVLSTFAGACASSGAAGINVPRPFPIPGNPGDPGRDGVQTRARPQPPPRTQPSSAVDGYALAGTALSLRGAPYRDGGADPTGFDCSGFTQYVFAKYGVALPREVRDQFHEGKSVKGDELTAGDLLFFTTVAPGPTHVGIAIGGDQFVHAPSSTGVVRVERLSSSYWSPRYLGARRVSARLESRALP